MEALTMKPSILALAGVASLALGGTALATTNTCKTVKHTATRHVHRTLASYTAPRTVRRKVHVLAAEPKAQTYVADNDRETTRRTTVYERDYVEAPPPPPVIYEEAYPVPYPYPYPGPIVFGYGPRWHGHWGGFHRRWR
jgi:hypothetical protein